MPHKTMDILGSEFGEHFCLHSRTTLDFLDRPLRPSPWLLWEISPCFQWRILAHPVFERSQRHSFTTPAGGSGQPSPYVGIAYTSWFSPWWVISRPVLRAAFYLSNSFRIYFNSIIGCGIHTEVLIPHGITFYPMAEIRKLYRFLIFVGNYPGLVFRPYLIGRCTGSSRRSAAIDLRSCTHWGQAAQWPLL